MNKAKLTKQYDVEDTIEFIRTQETDLTMERIELEDFRDEGITTVKKFQVTHNKQTYDVTVTLEEDGQRHYDVIDARGNAFDVEAEALDYIIALVDESGE